MNPDRSRYATGVYLLSAIGVGCTVLIVAGELLGGLDRRIFWNIGGLDRRIFWNIGGAALGAIFIVYGLILLLLRKMGMIGPRRAER